jgi:hypothetical protein
MPRLFACVTLLAAAACAGAVQPNANKGAALVVPSGGASKPRGKVAGVTASLDAHALLSLTFNAKAMDREAQASLASSSLVAVGDDDAKGVTAGAPAAELPLPKVRCAHGKLCPALHRLSPAASLRQGAATAGFERATVAHSPHAVTVTLYRTDVAAPVAPVTSGTVCLAAFGVVATIAASLAGAFYLISGGGTGLRHL